MIADNQILNDQFICKEGLEIRAIQTCIYTEWEK